MKRFLNAIIRRIIVFVCLFLPINKRKIVISSFYGRGYSDNPKYIVDSLLKMPESKNMKIIWMVKNKDDNSFPCGVEKCLNGSFKSIYHYLTAGVWIDNCRKSYFFKKPKTLYIQTWHGGGAQKKVEKDVIKTLSQHYEKMARRDSKQMDLAISDSKFATNLYRTSFWYNGPVAEIGYPRYDFLTKSDKPSNFLHKLYNIDETTKIVLYAPTFRDDRQLELQNFDFDSIVKSFNLRFGCNHVIMLRLHPNIAHLSKGLPLPECVVDVTMYPDFQDLVVGCDYIISDYSSVVFDFAIANKPAFRLALNYDYYRNSRDSYFDFDRYPYPTAYSIDELSKTIETFDWDAYSKNLEDFLNLIGFKNTKDSSNIIARMICEYSHSKISKKALFKKYNCII